MIVDEPFATAVTRPADDTVAIEELDVVHVTVAPDHLSLPTILPVRVSVVVASLYATYKLVGASVMLDAT